MTHEIASRPRLSLPRPLVLVVNRRGGSFARCQDRLHTALAREGLRVLEELDIRHLDRIQGWTTRTAPDRPVIVAVGGDGTVGSVANRLVNTGTSLGILPLGTHNDTARSLGIPRKIEAAVHLLVAGKVSTIDAARFVPDEGEPRYFAQAAAMGVQVEFARLATNSSIRRRFRRFTYLAASAAALRDRRPFTCDLVIGEQRLRRTLLYLTVLNAPVFGGPLQLRLSGASIDNRRLDVLAIEEMSLPRMLLALAPMVLGRTPRTRGVHVHHASRLRVECEPKQEVVLDGEMAGCAPGEFVLAPEALHVVTPRSFEDLEDE